MAHASSMRLVTVLAGELVTLPESDEWIKTLPRMKVRFSYQRLTNGFSASAEILEPVEATMVYTHTYVDLPAPTNRAHIEDEFVDELAKAEHLRIANAHPGRYRSAS